MWRAEKPPGLAQRRSRLFFTGVGVAGLVLLGVFTVTLRMNESNRTNAPLATAGTDDPGKSTVPSTTIVTRDEVVSRLHQIFRIRDRAIQTRDARVLSDIYTVDCPCLQGDQALIKRLRSEKLVWSGIEVSLIIEDVKQVNDRLWIVNALVKTSNFEIRRESGASVRVVPSGQEHSRFALSRPVGQDVWLLGQASVLAERG